MKPPRMRSLWARGWRPSMNGGSLPAHQYFPRSSTLAILAARGRRRLAVTRGLALQLLRPGVAPVLSQIGRVNQSRSRGVKFGDECVLGGLRFATIGLLQRSRGRSLMDSQGFRRRFLLDGNFAYLQ